MKKFFVLAVLLSIYYSVMGQEFALPKSFTNEQTMLNPTTISLDRPNYELAQTEDQDKNNVNYRGGLYVQKNIDLKKEFQIVLASDGSYIGQCIVNVPDAKALNVYFDNFNLQQGVDLYLMNANKKQILKYDMYNNNVYNQIGTDIVAGETLLLEINFSDIEAYKNSSINLMAFGAFYRGGIINDINQRYNNIESDVVLESDTCHINAMCPIGDDYRDVMKTAAHIVYPVPGGGGVYYCSGNLINNAKGDCKPYFITASHCESTNSMISTNFALWVFKFNYQSLACVGPSAPGASINGATFKARSPYNDASPAMIGDWLLLELIDPTNILGKSIKPYLGGWDRKPNTAIGETFISFHHPGGDPKKVTTFNRMYPDGNFNGGADNSHWSCVFENGGSEGGSSGSNLFQKQTKRIRGTLSGGPSVDNKCEKADWRRALYSKFHLNWEYINGGDGTSKTRLKDWLDPENTNMMSVNTVEYKSTATDCGTGLSIQTPENLDDYFQVYPNPTSDKKIFLNTSLKEANTYKISVYDMMGKVVFTSQTQKVSLDRMEINLSGLTNGIYMLKVESDNGVANKKFIISE